MYLKEMDLQECTVCTYITSTSQLQKHVHMYMCIHAMHSDLNTTSALATSAFTTSGAFTLQTSSTSNHVVSFFAPRAITLQV